MWPVAGPIASVRDVGVTLLTATALKREVSMSKPDNLNIAAIAERYAAAWITHDPAAILALHAPQSTFQAHGRTGVFRGADALRTEFAQIFERYPGFAVETHRLLLGERHWTLD